MTSPLSDDVWKKRADFRQQTRKFFDDHGYLEVETPHLLRRPSLEPHLDPYPVDLEHGKKGYLNTSPEVNLKKLLGSTQLKKIYELAHSYRSGERGGWHRSEFIMLEWYARGYLLQDLMEECSVFLESLFPSLPQHQIKVSDWFKKNLGIAPEFDSMRQYLGSQGLGKVEEMDWSECFFRLFLPTESKLEPMGIVFLYDYPEELSSYAKVKGGVAKRFEVYLHGVEVGNAFEERTSRHDMLEQLQKEERERAELQKERLFIDDEFAGALDHIKEPVSGIAMGWDRLFSLWLGDEELEKNCPYPNWADEDG